MILAEVDLLGKILTIFHYLSFVFVNYRYCTVPSMTTL